MKKAGLLIIIFGLLFLTSCTSDPQLKDIRSRGVLRVGIKVDVPLFGYLNSETNEIDGMEIDLARALAKELLGDENAVSLVAVTTKTRGPLLENGGVDVIMATFTITEERKKTYNFSEPYYIDEIGFLVLKDSSLHTIADMNGKTIGVAQSGTARAAIEKLAQEMNLNISYKEYASYPEVKAGLLAGEVNALSIDKSILSGYVDDKTLILDDGFNPQEYGIATKLENKNLAKRVDDFVKKMKKNGELDAMIARWGV